MELRHLNGRLLPGGRNVLLGPKLVVVLMRFSSLLFRKYNIKSDKYTFFTSPRRVHPYLFFGLFDEPSMVHFSFLEITGVRLKKFLPSPLYLVSFVCEDTHISVCVCVYTSVCVYVYVCEDVGCLRFQRGKNVNRTDLHLCSYYQ